MNIVRGRGSGVLGQFLAVAVLITVFLGFAELCSSDESLEGVRVEVGSQAFITEANAAGRPPIMWQLTDFVANEDGVVSGTLQMIFPILTNETVRGAALFWRPAITRRPIEGESELHPAMPMQAIACASDEGILCRLSGDWREEGEPLPGSNGRGKLRSLEIQLTVVVVIDGPSGKTWHVLPGWWSSESPPSESKVGAKPVALQGQFIHLAHEWGRVDGQQRRWPIRLRELDERQRGPRQVDRFEDWVWRTVAAGNGHCE